MITLTVEQLDCLSRRAKLDGRRSVTVYTLDGADFVIEVTWPTDEDGPEEVIIYRDGRI